MQTKAAAPELGDRQFLDQFENKTLNPSYFNHRGHSRLAWLYLNHHDVDTAVERVCTGIEAYASSLGAATKFHLTLTDAIVRIMARRMDKMDEKDWSLFLDQNKDLVEDARSVLGQYFSKDHLFSETARTSLVQPDLKPL
jgi:hypothetical protein